MRCDVKKLDEKKIKKQVKPLKKKKK